MDQSASDSLPLQAKLAAIAMPERVCSDRIGTPDVQSSAGLIFCSIERSLARLGKSLDEQSRTTEILAHSQEAVWRSRLLLKEISESGEQLWTARLLQR